MKTESFVEHYSFQPHFPELAHWTSIDQRDVFSAAQPFILQAKHGKSPSVVMRARATLRRLAKSATLTPEMVIHRNGSSLNSRWAS